jgi:hypothetical protein
MPNTILKRWNGSAFEELYPKTVVTQISASGTPSSTTFLRGDGQWATPAGTGTVTNVTAGTQISGMSMTITNGTTTPSIATSISSSANFRTAIDAAITSHATSATTYGVGTNTNYGHVKGLRLTGASDGESGVVVLSGVAYATKTLRVNGVAQAAWGTLLDLDTTEGNIVRFVDLTLIRTEGGITYYIGSIMVDVNALPTNNFSTTPSPTITSGLRWRLNSRNSSNTQLTLPIYMFRDIQGSPAANTLRVYVDNATSATYDYECVGYF